MTKKSLKTKKTTKTYVYVFREYNSHNQEGTTTVIFKAESLDQLNEYVDLYQNGDVEKIPRGRFSIKHKLPKNFWDAGGFCADDVSFTCKETGEDMRDWWKTNGWGVIGSY